MREIGGSIDAERNGVNEGGVNAHVRLQSAQLFEPLAMLEHAPGKRDEASESRPPEGVDPDMMV